MQFLALANYDELTQFEKFLRMLQINFNILYSITNKYIEISPYSFTRHLSSQRQMAQLVSYNVMDKSHSYFRCWSSRTFFQLLFNFNLIPDKNEEQGDVSIYYIDLGGKNFPDHTFIVIKYQNIHYIIQSYYFAYSVRGKYGLIKLNDDDWLDFSNIITEYKRIEKTPMLASSFFVQTINKRLERYTGVNSEKHGPDMNREARKHKPNTCTFIQKNVAFHNFIMAVILNLNDLKMFIQTHNVHPLQFGIQYKLYDCFLDSESREDSDRETLHGISIDTTRLVYFAGHYYFEIKINATFTTDECVRAIDNVLSTI